MRTKNSVINCNLLEDSGWVVTIEEERHPTDPRLVVIENHSLT